MKRFSLSQLSSLMAFAAMALFAVVSAPAASTPGHEVPGGTYDEWMQHRDTLAQAASVDRYYTFEGLHNAADLVPNLAGGKAEPLTFHSDAGPGDFKLVPGRWPERSAVRLDQGSFASPAPEVTGNAFTATLWFRKLGQGVQRGNSGSTTGMLLAVGNGYYEGWRVTTAYPSRRLGFEIGRPSGAVGCDTEAVSDDVWHHLAVSWDGHTMRVYVDGEPAATGAYAGPYTPPGGAAKFSNGQFRIGFAGSGIGSVVMDVDEAVLYRRALSPEEVLQDAYFYAPFTDAQKAYWTAANAAADRKDYAAAKRELKALLTTGTLNTDIAALVRLHLCDLYRADGESLAATAQIQQVLSSPHTATRLQRQAQEKLLALLQESAGAPLPRILYDTLLVQPEITPQERLTLRLNLGHSLAASKDYAAARVEYHRIVVSLDATPDERTLAQLCAARTWVRAGDYPHAQVAYAQIKAQPGALPNSMAAKATMAEVAERLGEIARLKAGKPAADPQAGRVQLAKRSLPGLWLYVAPSGNKTNSGTKAKPFATLEQARDAIRTLRNAKGLPRGGICVVVRGGTYPLRKTFILTSQDTSDTAHPIVYHAAAGETPIFDAGAPVHGFTPVQDQAILARLPSEAGGHVLQTDLKAQGITDFGTFTPGGFGSARGFKTHPLLQLYFNGAAMPLAHWPNDGYIQIAAAAPDAKDTFSYAEDRPARWKDEKDTWLYGYWFYNWADSYEKIGTIDTTKKTITLAPPVTTYGDGKTSFLPGQRFRAVNVLSELDQPGEWYLDRDSSLLYFYPPSDPAQAEIEVSISEQPVVSMKNVSNVSLEGLTWQNGRGDGLLLTNCNSCLVAGCTIRQFGGNGVQIDGGTNDGLLGCDIHTLGRGGTLITGGDRKTLAPGGHFIENCDVYDFSLVDHTYTPAVLLSGVGNRIAHNRFHQAYSSAMRIEGNDNVIEYNDVGKVLLESDDQGASDMWADTTYRGNVFRYNYWHDMGNGQGVGQAGIRLDDWISGVRIYGNIFQRCADGGFGGVQINQGADNLIENNLFIDCKAAVSGGAGSPDGWQRFLTGAQGKGYLESVQALKLPYTHRYPELLKLGQNSRNSVERNIVLDCGTFIRDDQRFDLLDNAVAAANPGFTDPENRDFSVKLGTPLWNRLSFEPIPFRQIGLYEDRYRKRK
jgi:hypothetical protein